MRTILRLCRALGVLGMAVLVLSAVWQVRSGASTALLASGSSFAGPEVLQWQHDTSLAPYNLNINYNSTSSGDGRFNFANKTVDFAVSDIRYLPYPFDTKSPSFPFMYVPVTAGGLAFMYHLGGFNATLQLSSYSACAVFTGGVGYWDDSIIKADNPGVTLPHVAVHPVTRQDPAGTNFVLQEYCIHEQPDLWKAFINSVSHLTGQVGDLSTTEPRSDWPLFSKAIPVTGSATAADTVASPSNNGYVTAVETAYAIQRHTPVASVKNASGDYTQPTAVDVASALAYATQQSDGTHVLNFDGVGPHVYNPSTYSYLIAPTTGFNSQKGHDLSAFGFYALTIGQQRASEIGYASLGLSLEQFGVQRIQANIPGAGSLTASEQTAFASGDLTPADVAAGRTTPEAGAKNPTVSPTTGSSGSTGSAGTGSSVVTGSGGAGSSVVAGSGGGATAGSTGAASGQGAGSTAGTAAVSAGGGGASTSSGGSTVTSGSGGGASSVGAAVDPNVSLDSGAPAAPLARTGGYQDLLGALGVGVMLIGEVGRRRMRVRLS